MRLIILLLLAAPSLAGGYLDGETISMTLVETADAARDHAAAFVIGESRGKRPLTGIRVGLPGSVPLKMRPRVLVVAGLNPDHRVGSTVAARLAARLLDAAAKDEILAERLRRSVVEILPLLNPDGLHALLHQFPAPPRHHARAWRLTRQRVDQDRDGYEDEDGPRDLDGDAVIATMRVRDAAGRWRVSDEDPRLMVKVAPGEAGGWRLLTEGLDDDEDGRFNEDGPGGYDMNRNWPGDWQPHWIQWGAGPYPLCYPETRAVGDFLLAHPEIAAVQSYHNTGGMILRGPGQRGIADYPREDLRVYDALGKAGEEMLPHYRYMKIGDDLYPVRGGFVTWAFENLGMFSFTNELWTWRQLRNERREERKDDGDRWSPARRAERDRKRLRSADLLDMGATFVPWRPYDHPTLGRIEIGGWTRIASRVPPTYMLEELCHRNAMFTIHHAEQMPELRFDPVEITNLGGGLWRVRASVRNLRLIPTIARLARDRRIGLPDFFSLEGATVVAGGRLEGERFRERVVPQEHRAHRLRIDSGVPSHGRVRVEWIVKHDGETPPAVKLEYRSQKGGTIRR